MGKRKRSSDHNQNQTHSLHFPSPPPLKVVALEEKFQLSKDLFLNLTESFEKNINWHLGDSIPCSSGMELLAEEQKPLHAIDSSDLKPLSSVLDVKDNSMKLRITNTSVPHHQSLGRSFFLKRSRHFYGHQYSRRNSSNVANLSSSRGKGTSLRDDKLSFKFTTQCNPESGRHSEEITERAFFRPERIRSSLVMDMVPPDLVRMVCGICQKTLKRKTYFLGSILSSSEPSVVAVLVCDHVYHADCLEEKTNSEDRQDPPCPLCMGLLPKVEGSKESRA